MEKGLYKNVLIYFCYLLITLYIYIYIASVNYTSQFKKEASMDYHVLTEQCHSKFPITLLNIRQSEYFFMRITTRTRKQTEVVNTF